MTAKEYLANQLRGEWAEPTSVQTRTGLSAYAIRMYNNVKGYSISDAKKLIKSCGCGKDFSDKCICFLSDVNNFMEMSKRIPVLDD